MAIYIILIVWRQFTTKKRFTAVVFKTFILWTQQIRKGFTVDCFTRFFATAAYS